MPELRKDPIVGRWVIIATDRAKRPVAPQGRAAARRRGFCPFCEGNEDHTPHEILAYRERNTRPDEKGWRVRVVPNKFPALQIEGDLQQARRRHLRPDERHRRPRGHPRVPVPRSRAWPTSRRRTSARCSGSTATGSSI